METSLSAYTLALDALGVNRISMVPSSERYMRLRNRLARWLRWMSERRSEPA